MSTTVKSMMQMLATVGGENKAVGNITAPLEHTAGDSEVYDVKCIVADDYTEVTLWQDGDAGVSDFDALFIETDADILIQFTIDRAGTPEYVTIEVAVDATVGKGRLFLFSDDMYVGALQGSGSIETMDQIDQIVAKNNVADDAGDANVRLVLLT